MPQRFPREYITKSDYTSTQKRTTTKQKCRPSEGVALKAQLIQSSNESI